MNRVQFTLNGETLNLTTLTPQHKWGLSKQLQCSCHELFGQCFRETPNKSCEPMFLFTQTNGCGIVVSDQSEMALLLVSFIYDSESKTVEIYNVCKNPKNRDISAFIFLDTLFQYFIPNNPLFAGCQTLRLALLCSNKYLVPAFITYCRLGFRVDQPNRQMNSLLPQHVTMTRNLVDMTPSHPRQEFRTMAETCHYQTETLRAIQTTLTEKLPIVTFSNVPWPTSLESDRDQLITKMPFPEPETAQLSPRP